MGLARVMATRVRTSLVSFGSRAERYHDGVLEVEVLRNWVPRGRFLVDPINPTLLARLRGADVIHCHQTHTLMSSAALLYARAAGIPIFTTNLGGGGLGFHEALSRWYAGHLHISEFSRAAYRQQNLPTARVILGGVDLERFCPAPEVKPSGGVLFVGRLVPHKGINYLIEAIDRATPLSIIGRRWWKDDPRFQALLRRLAEGKQVRFNDHCDDAGLVDAYRRSLCVVLPSVYVTVFGERYQVPELLGQTLLEGMACGRPAICSAVGGMPEVVVDGVTGFVVPPNDPVALRERIEWLQRHPAEADAMGREARRHVENGFSWSGVVDRCLAAYASTLRPRR